MNPLTQLRIVRRKSAWVVVGFSNAWVRSTTLICGALLISQAAAEVVQFNEDFLPVGSGGINFELYQSGNPVMAGEYAPVVRGIARTNARVTLCQGGNLLMKATVSPGAFAIDDLYAAGYGSDLQVSILEADGTEQNFIVPCSSVNQLLRPGASRFSLTVGETRNYYVDEQAKLLLWHSPQLEVRRRC